MGSLIRFSSASILNLTEYNIENHSLILLLMFRKDEKKALTRLAILSIGWPAGLDRFYDGKIKNGIFSIIGWGVIFGSILLLSPCHGYDYSAAGKDFSDMSISPWIVIPLVLGVYGGVLVLRKGFRLFRQFESAQD